MSGQKNPNELTVPGKPGEDERISVARNALRPTVQAAVTVREYGKVFGELDLAGLVDSLMEQVRESQNGSTGRAEAMLTAQAHTLDAIFNNLAQRAINMQYIDHLDRYLKLALRAQSQCRATWEALSTIQNPPVAGYVGQANIAHGPQQVNNAAIATEETSGAPEKHNLKNKLLEECHGERLDPGTARTTGRADPEMATLGEINRADNR